MFCFVCTEDLNSNSAVNEIAAMLNEAKRGLYLTASQSIKKLRTESSILSSFFGDNIYSITEFIQKTNKEVYATEDVLSVADSRYILKKIIEYNFKDNSDKIKMFYEMRYDIFELFRTLMFHDKTVTEKGIAQICHDFSCVEKDIFELYISYRYIVGEVIKIIRGNETELNLDDVLGENFLKDKKAENIDLFVNKQKETVIKKVKTADFIVFDGFLFFNDMQKFIIKTAKENDIKTCFVIKVLGNNLTDFLLEENFRMLAAEMGEEITLPTIREKETESETQLQYFKNKYPEIYNLHNDIPYDGSIKVYKPFVNREEELRFVVTDISNKLEQSYNGDINQLIQSVNNDFAIITGIEKEKYQERISNLFREKGVFIFKGSDSLIDAGYSDIDESLFEKVYFKRNDFLKTEIPGLEYNDKYRIFEKCFSRIEITKNKRPIATYPVGQFIIEIYRIIANGMSVEGFKSILFSNWKYTLDNNEPLWSKYISDFKYIEIFLQDKKTVSEWIEEIQSIKKVKSRIADDPLYVYHPIMQISNESLDFFADIISAIGEICDKIGSVVGSIEQHVEALKGMLSSASTITNSADEDLEFEQLIVKRIINAVNDIGNNSLMNNISSVYFAENIQFMINEWEQQNEEEDDCKLRLNVVNLENMQSFKHSYFIMAETEKYPRHYHEKFPFSRDIITILSEPKYGIGIRTGEVRGLDYHLKLERYLFKNVLDFTTESLTITSSEKEGNHHNDESIYVKDIISAFGEEVRQCNKSTESSAESGFNFTTKPVKLAAQKRFRLTDLAIFKLCPKLYYHCAAENNKGVYLNDFQLRFYAEAVLFCEIFNRFVNRNLEQKAVFQIKDSSYRRIIEQVAETAFEEHLCNFDFMSQYEMNDLKRNVVEKIVRFVENGKQYVKGQEFTLIPYSDKIYGGDGYELVIEHDNRYVDYTNRTYRMSQNSTYLEFLVMKTTDGKSQLIHYKDMIDALDRNDENEDRINLVARIISKINIQFDSKRFAGDGIKRTDELVKEINDYDFSDAKAMSSNYCSYCRLKDICMQQ